MLITRLHFDDVTPSPDLPWTEPTFPVFGYRIEHPDGPILVDTGVGIGSSLIDRLYAPVHHPVELGTLQLVVCSHLHFDHCGRNPQLAGVPIVVQRAEVEAARAPRYTVPAWADPRGATLQVVDGEREVTAGVRVVPTPGHTAGHQSVVVDGGTEEGPTVIAAQAARDAAAFEAGHQGDEHVWDQEVGRASIARLRALRPVRVLFSHDIAEWRPPP